MNTSAQIYFRINNNRTIITADLYTRDAWVTEIPSLSIDAKAIMIQE